MPSCHRYPPSRPPEPARRAVGQRLAQALRRCRGPPRTVRGCRSSRSSRAGRSCGSTGVDVRARSTSTARLWAMVDSQARTDPRRVSKTCACRQARSNVCWATSSAVVGSPSTVTATPNTTRWNRRTKASDSSASPAPSPARSVSSGSRSAGIPILCTLSDTAACPRDWRYSPEIFLGPVSLATFSSGAVMPPGVALQPPPRPGGQHEAARDQQHGRRRMNSSISEDFA